MASQKIAIIGAGPGGLTLARLLQKNGVPCTVYESDKDRNTRDQGGSLDLHGETGQQSLREAGLFEEFQKHSRPEGQASRLLRYDGHIYWDENQLDTTGLRQAGKDDRPEIDRVKLREILLDSLDPTSIKWNHKVDRVEADVRIQGKKVLHFADGSKETNIDLLVGADGAWSKVRPLLTDERPFYSGITGLELWSLDVSNKNQWLSNFVGAGTMFMFDEGRAVMAQRNGGDSIRTYACVRQPEDWKDTCGINWSDHDAARETLIRDYFSDCSDDLKRVIRSSRDGCVVRQMYMLPVGVTWPSCPGVTLIGDAAHLMTPFAGVGVNVAMTDALALAGALIAKKDGFFAKVFSDGHNISAAVKDYEKFMFRFAKKNAERTAEGLKGHFTQEGAKERAVKYIKLYEERTGRALSEGTFNPVSV